MPSLRSSSVMFVMWHLSSMPPSINKQFLLSCHLCGLCFHSEPFYFLSSIAISVTSISLTSLSPPGPHPAPPLISCTPNNSPLQFYHHPLNCHTCYFSLFSLPASFYYLVLSLSDGYAILTQSVCSVQNIKSESPARRAFLDRICLSRSHRYPQRCRLHSLTSPLPSQPFDCDVNSCLTMGEWQLHFAKCYSHLYTLKLIRLRIIALVS